MLAICSTHGEVTAKQTHQGLLVVLHCDCGLVCEPVEIEDKPPTPTLAEGMEPVEIDVLLEDAKVGGGWYEFEDGAKVKGRPAALRYVMEDATNGDT